MPVNVMSNVEADFVTATTTGLTCGFIVGIGLKVEAGGGGTMHCKNIEFAHYIHGAQAKIALLHFVL